MRWLALLLVGCAPVAEDKAADTDPADTDPPDSDRPVDTPVETDAPPETDESDPPDSGESLPPIDTGPPPPGTLSTIPDVRQGHHPAGTLVRIEGAVVTAVRADRGFSIQDPTATAFAGIYVYKGNGGVIPAIGDVVDLVGGYEEFDNDGVDPAPLGTLSQLMVDSHLTSPAYPQSAITVRSSGATLAPLPVDVDALGDPVAAEPWESMLVTVVDACPLAVASDPAGIGGFDEFDLSDQQGHLTRVDNEYTPVHDHIPTFSVGDTFVSVTGTVYFSFSRMKVAPRTLADAAGYVDGGQSCP